MTCSFEECSNKTYKEKLCKIHFNIKKNIIRDIYLEVSNNFYHKQKVNDFELYEYKEYLIDSFDNIYKLINNKLVMVGYLENNEIIFNE